VLWVLASGEGWAKLPDRYPSPPTCRRRFEEWQADGTLAEIVKRLGTSGRKISLRGRIGATAAKPPAPPSFAARSGPIRHLGVRRRQWRDRVVANPIDDDHADLRYDAPWSMQAADRLANVADSCFFAASGGCPQIGFPKIRSRGRSWPVRQAVRNSL
jgi:putative transposase